jgi:hypothetical protein
MWHLSKRCAVLLAIFLMTLNGCVIAYRNYPREMLKQRFSHEKSGKLYYNIDGASLAGGYLALRDVFRERSPFAEVEEREFPPASGVYVAVKIRSLSHSVLSALFGYLSYATLTVLPAWSNDGYIVRFTVHRDGEILKAYEYDPRRFTAVWLGLLPFFWANAFTANEREVFQAVGNKFFEEAAGVLGISG